MATAENALHSQVPVESAGKRKHLLEGMPFDWIAAILFAIIVGGVYLDGWAHAHGLVDNTFFTPWHAVLYASMAVSGVFLVATMVANHRRGYAWRESLPAGYGFSLLGVVIFAIGGVLDMIWHILFGVEVSVEALLSPTHIMLAFGAVLIITGPLRAAWLRFPGIRAYGWLALFPALLSATVLLAMFTFFTQYAHPLVRPWAANTTHTVSSLPSDVYLMNVDGTNQTRLISSSLNHWDIAVAHSGQKIAFAAGKDGNLQIYVANIDGNGQVRLTNNNFDEWGVAWSPDDSQLLFNSNRNGNKPMLYTMHADGSNLKQLTTTSAMKAVWSPDGKKIAFISDRDGSNELYIMNADGSNQTRLTHLNANGTWWPWWFPDGKKLAFSTDSGGKSGIFTINIDGSKLMRLTDSDNSGYNWAPAVSPDGAKIAFVSDRTGNADVFTMNPDGSHQRDISNNPGLENGNGGIAWTPDNNKLLYVGQAHQVVDEDTSHIIGIASFLLQSAIFMGLALLLLSRWMLPLGSFTLIVTLSSALLSVLNDQYPLVVTAVAAGLLIDALVWWLKPSRSRVVEFRIVAFFLPVIFFSLYYLGLFYTQGVSWSIHLWMGSIVLAGVVGLLLSYLALQMPSSGEEQA